MNDLRNSISEVINVIPQYSTVTYQGNIDLIMQQTHNLVEIIGSIYIDMLQNIEIVHMIDPNADVSCITLEIKEIMSSVEDRNSLEFADFLIKSEKTLFLYKQVQQSYFEQKEKQTNE